MSERTSATREPRHLRIVEPSPWVVRFSPLIPAGGIVLDVACGGGRHTAHLLDGGHHVIAVDRDTATIAERLGGSPNLEVLTADLEGTRSVFADGGPLAGRRFDGIVVVNYLHRPLFPNLLAALAPGGVLIYETFARGNEDYAKPRNPDHLLRSGELLDVAADRLQVVAYEHGLLTVGDIPGVKQRLVAVNDRETSQREDDEPAPHPIDP